MSLDKGWIPVKQPGGVYCSPRCGCKCKRADYDAARVASKELASTLGKGWTPHVWENFGWHYKVIKGRASISPTSYRGRISGYICYFNTSSQFICEGRTAKSALKKSIKKAEDAVIIIKADIAKVL